MLLVLDNRAQSASSVTCLTLKVPKKSRQQNFKKYFKQELRANSKDADEVALLELLYLDLRCFQIQLLYLFCDKNGDLLSRIITNN